MIDQAARRIAEDHPEQFLRIAIFDEDGRDAGYPPIELPNMAAGSRCGLHQACGKPGLFHETSIGEVMVIGSGKNKLGEQRLAEINRFHGWTGESYVPHIDTDSDEETEDTNDIPEQQMPPMLARVMATMAEVNMHRNKAIARDAAARSHPVPGLQRQRETVRNPFCIEAPSGSNVEQPSNGPWDITGNWELKCPKMASCCGQFSPYTLSIYNMDNGKEIYDRFDLG